MTETEVKHTYSEWQVINAEIDKSTVKRINWKESIGMTLTHATAVNFAEGRTAQETITRLTETLHENGLSDPKYLKNLKIGVYARFGEIKTESMYINSIKKR